MGTGKPRTNTAAPEPAGRVVRVELAPGRVLAELELGQVAVLELVTGLAVVPELETAPVVELELVIGQVAAPELETALVAELAPEIDPAVAALERGPAVAELEPDQAEVVLAPGHSRGQPGVAPTKSATAAHRRDLVPLLAAEDLAAAAAGTTREPAAAEAVIAWEVAE
jgi:hypothetical protein